MSTDKNIVFGSTKTYTHSVGFSCCFRQWRAKSHCRLLHGYALKVKFEFRCLSEYCDENGWVQDFGGLDNVKSWLKGMFDHKTLVAQSDPALQNFMVMQDAGLIQLVILPEVGCENFARTIFVNFYKYIHLNKGVVLHKVTVAEHEGNSAYVERGYTL